jgi:hypothetical protein
VWHSLSLYSDKQTVINIFSFHLVVQTGNPDANGDVGTFTLDAKNEENKAGGGKHIKSFLGI